MWRGARASSWRAREGRDTNGVARRLRVSPATVCKWRARFLRDRLDGLFDEPRPGAPRTITDDQIEQVIIRTLETTPRGATHWSTRDMAKAVGLSRMTVNRIWRAFGLQPHRSETFKLSPDPLLIEKVRDIVGLYMNPPEHAVVFCVDEKPRSKPWIARNRSCRCGPGQVERRTHDYNRHGTTTLFAALDVEDESGHHAVPSAPSLGRVSAVPRCDRDAGARATSTCTSSWTTTARTRRR